MNKPLPKTLHNKYDTVIDSGTLEHIFKAPEALEYCLLLCKPGGQILHMLPSNNWCGHGFWQFSPELIL
jgi:2-polyprenyl-3-methyl-5-hydroxy-6-metoxy-1,4-benzoquinol methylase